MHIKKIITGFVLLSILFNNGFGVEKKGIKVGTFRQQVRTFYSTKNGLPSDDVRAIAVTDNGNVYAGTHRGLAVFSNGKWNQIEKLVGKSIWSLAAKGDKVAVFTANKKNGQLTNGVVFVLDAKGVQQELHLPKKFKLSAEKCDLAIADKLLLGTAGGLYTIDINKKKHGTIKPKLLGLVKAEIRQIAVGDDGTIWIASHSALYRWDKNHKKWEPVYPHDGARSWALIDARGVAFDRLNRLWFASPDGVGYYENKWTLFTGREGLPYNDFTVVAAGEKGVIWFGTHKGAIRYDGKYWEYRQGLRWLPDDDVRDIAVSEEGHAWFATKKGVGVIEQRPMTLAEKAKWYEDEIDRYHRRTPYEFVLEVSVSAPGDKTNVQKRDSDNDGLWTSMYGAGECFAYAATKDPKAKARAKKAFEAMRFLMTVTQGGEHSPPPGYVARTILPTSGPDPNIGRIENDIRHQKNNDRLWKVYEPRWPKSADGKWYWKSDTSSDELDGHYFLYAQYYDLVAETEEEKAPVREQVRALTDHLIEHDFMLVDHDGKPTRWARFNPQELNFDQNWFVERGLNSLSMLSYLAVAEHVTGDPKYREIADMLIEKHSYLQNMMKQKFQHGMGTGNQSDDEMAFMNYYNLIKYEKDPERKSRYAMSFYISWCIEQPEMNPFFNFAFAASCADLSYTDAFGTYSTAPTGDWLEDSIETLKRFPLDRFNWRHENMHRIDILPIPEANRMFDEGSFRGRKGYRVNGKVVPVDETYFSHWNHDLWQLNPGGNGTLLGDGAVFLLPYYMGLYHGFIIE